MSSSAARSLRRADESIEVSVRRLSSGLRVNSAMDDAAGVAISTRLSTQVDGLGAGLRKVADAGSAVQVAEHALGDIASRLQRLRELALTSTNGALRESDRASIDREVQELLADIDRTADSASLGGTKLLDGNLGTLDINLGSGVGDRLKLHFDQRVGTDTLGAIVGADTPGFAGLARLSDRLTLAPGQLTIRVGDAEPRSVTGEFNTTEELAAAIREQVPDVAVRVKRTNTVRVATTSVFGNNNPTRGRTQTLSFSAAAAVRADGAVAVWGTGATVSAFTPAVSASLASGGGVREIFQTGTAMAALKNDGSVVAWGSVQFGGNPGAAAARLTEGVVSVSSNDSAFAAVKADGSVVTWGIPSDGGDSSSVANQLSGGVQAVFSTSLAFAALDADGSVVTWGNAAQGGNSLAVASELSSGVETVYNHRSGFAALKTDGSVVSWGADANTAAVASQLTNGVRAITSTTQLNSFIALKDDGSVVHWGSASTLPNAAAQAQLGSGVREVFANGSAAAAVKEDGSVVTWGVSAAGGDSSAVAASLTKVTQIAGSNTAFAALREDGSVVTWGNPNNGGSKGVVAGLLASGVRQVFGTQARFAALKTDGTLVTWSTATDGTVAATGVKSVSIVGGGAMVALKEDGTLVGLGTTPPASLTDVFAVADAHSAVVGPGETGLELSAGSRLTIGGSVGVRLGFPPSGVVSGSLVGASAADPGASEELVLRIDTALESVNSMRSMLGGYAARLEAINSALGGQREDLVAARSRIVDADYATETAAFTRDRIQREAALAMLAQAKVAPQSAIELIERSRLTL